jgi:hypothetical protein
LFFGVPEGASLSIKLPFSKSVPLLRRPFTTPLPVLRTAFASSWSMNRIEFSTYSLSVFIFFKLAATVASSAVAASIAIATFFKTVTSISEMFFFDLINSTIHCSDG